MKNNQMTQEMHEIISKIASREVMAKESYSYQTWVIMKTFEWLDQNGYEINEKRPKLVV